jgi:hypothetical protein
MSSDPYWPLPPRLVGCTDSTELVRWHLRLAIICMEDGSATTLANRLGVTRNTVHLAVHRGSCTDELAKRIEQLFGREFFPRELFVPEPELPVE